MAIFHSYVSHYQRVNPIKIPWNYHFPMVFLWFSYGIIPTIPLPTAGQASVVGPAPWATRRCVAASGSASPLSRWTWGLRRKIWDLQGLEMEIPHPFLQGLVDVINVPFFGGICFTSLEEVFFGDDLPYLGDVQLGHLPMEKRCWTSLSGCLEFGFKAPQSFGFESAKRTQSGDISMISPQKNVEIHRWKMLEMNQWTCGFQRFHHQKLGLTNQNDG